MYDKDEDPIIQEVREARKKLVDDAKRAGKTLGEYLRESEKKYADRLVSRQPKRLVRNKTG